MQTQQEELLREKKYFFLIIFTFSLTQCLSLPPPPAVAISPLTSPLDNQLIFEKCDFKNYIYQKKPIPYVVDFYLGRYNEENTGAYIYRVIVLDNKDSIKLPNNRRLHIICKHIFFDVPGVLINRRIACPIKKGQIIGPKFYYFIPRGGMLDTSIKFSE